MSGDVLLRAIDQYPTPFYLFDEGELHRQVAHLRSLLSPQIELCYAMKANSFVLQQAARDVERIEVCSPGEAYTCFELGIPDEKIVISGVHKDVAFIGETVRAHPGIARYTVESRAQFDLLCQAAHEAGRPISILMRLTSGNQFGIAADEVVELARRCKEEPLVEFCGIQHYSGTQKTSSKRIGRELRGIDRLIARLWEECGVRVAELEYGPGLPVSYYEPAEVARAEQDELIAALDGLLADMDFDGKVALELGRGMVASCGTYATGIVDTKSNETGNYAIVDGGKHQFVYYGNAMSMRQPPCALIPERIDGTPAPWNICGSLCTVTDIMVKQLEVCEPRVGDVLCFGRAGAYCMTEGISLFLSRDLPAVVMCDTEGNLRLVRKRLESWSLNSPTIVNGQIELSE